METFVIELSRTPSFFSLLLPKSGGGNYKHFGIASVRKYLFIFQLLGECHCWLASESPCAHVAMFSGRLVEFREHQNFPY